MTPGTGRVGTARGRHWARAAVAGLVSAVLVASCSSSPSRSSEARGPAPVQPVAAGNVPLGVYVGPGDPASVSAFARRTWTKPTLASDYLPNSRGWGAMTKYAAVARFVGSWPGRGYRLILGVPMIPTRDGQPAGTLAGGAAGMHDAEFKTLARTLVRYGESNAILRLGWEFNAPWYAWAVTDSSSAAAYATYFRRIVDAMRSVPGAAFRFVWNPEPGPTSFDLARAYPGDAYVDYVGLDVYDQVWDVAPDPTSAWTYYVGEGNGLRWLSSFAAAHHKPVAIPEWGLAIRSDGHGLGDDPAFVAHMAGWFTTHNVAFSSYFNLNAPDGEHDLLDGHFRQSLSIFKQSFAAEASVRLAQGARPG